MHRSCKTIYEGIFEQPDNIEHPGHVPSANLRSDSSPDFNNPCTKVKEEINDVGDHVLVEQLDTTPGELGTVHGDLHTHTFSSLAIRVKVEENDGNDNNGSTAQETALKPDIQVSVSPSDSCEDTVKSEQAPLALNDLLHENEPARVPGSRSLPSDSIDGNGKIQSNEVCSVASSKPTLPDSHSLTRSQISSVRSPDIGSSHWLKVAKFIKYAEQEILVSCPGKEVDFTNQEHLLEPVLVFERREDIDINGGYRYKLHAASVKMSDFLREHWTELSEEGIKRTMCPQVVNARGKDVSFLLVFIPVDRWHRPLFGENKVMVTPSKSPNGLVEFPSKEQLIEPLLIVERRQDKDMIGGYRRVILFGNNGKNYLKAEKREHFVHKLSMLEAEMVLSS
ncbi:hypothetical protein MAR_017601 [Mya arenaria]|uniref:Uncharacterized protein n=1 Tax=Mya arenaria TaxID=6604 RepID=A0ABY7EG55_MYAAR|nr:hypothetical protein MAR_017601 [Mya arenaria]